MENKPQILSCYSRNSHFNHIRQWEITWAWSAGSSLAFSTKGGTSLEENYWNQACCQRRHLQWAQLGTPDLQRILLALGVLGKWAGVLGGIQGVVHGRNISSGTQQQWQSDSSLQLSAPHFMAMIFQLYFIFIFGGWKVSLGSHSAKNPPQPRGAPATSTAHPASAA